MAAKPSARRKIYLQMKEQGKCPRCGIKIKKSSNYTFCDDCRAYFRDFNRENSDSLNAMRKTRYAQRKENNQCPRCGKKLGKRYEKTLCPLCLEKQYGYNNV